MLDLVGKGFAQTCNGATRRELLQAGTLGAIGLSLPDLLAAEEKGLKEKDDDRACIMIFNLGGPSQMDTFDMKPNAPAEVRGPFKPISTKGDFQVSESSARLAFSLPLSTSVVRA